MKKQTYRFDWNGIEIEAVYTPEGYGPYAHLEIRSINPERTPLPMTETGYKSHFHPQGMIEAHEGGVIGQVTAWLDEEAQKPEWQTHLEANRQGCLF
jgi:hypothetical protein